MPDIEFIFPNLDENIEKEPTETETSESAPNHTDNPSPAEQSYSEQLFSSIMDSRYVSLDNDDIDVSEFPALRNALGISPDKTIEFVFTDDETEFSPTEDVSGLFSQPELPKEEPIPSIFAGIGRSDWTSFELNLLADKSTQESDISVEEDIFSGNEPEFEDEEPIDTEYLLDYIDDIEFSGMEAEPLAPVKIIQSTDPYNSSFNAHAADEHEEEFDEFEIKSNYIFEES